MYRILYIPYGEFITSCPIGSNERFPINPYHPAKACFSGITILELESIEKAKNIITNFCYESYWNITYRVIEEEFEIVEVK